MKFQQYLVEAIARKTSYMKGAPGESSGIPGFRGKKTMGGQGSEESAFAVNPRGDIDVRMYKEKIVDKKGEAELKRLKEKAEQVGSTLDAAIRVAVDREIDIDALFSRFGL